jgi:hypothetical protein
MRYNELLKRFETIVSVGIDKTKELKALLSESSSDITLNARQRDGIMSRCSGFLSGKSYQFIENNNFKTYKL